MSPLPESCFWRIGSFSGPDRAREKQFSRIGSFAVYIPCISNTQMLGQMLINCKFPMTSKSNMLHGVNHPYMVICNQSAIFTIVLLVAYLNLYTFNTFHSIIIRTPEFSCSIKGHCTPVRKYASVFHINTTYIVNVNVYNEWLYTNTKKPADTMEVDPYSST